MDFSEALLALKKNNRLYRVGWNGKRQWLELQKPDENSKMSLPYIYMSIIVEDQDKCDRVPWLASQTDLLSNDWEML